MKVLVTGAAGFIGFHLVNRLITEGFEVVGLDIINNYYDVNLKYSRLKECGIDEAEINENILINSNKYSNYQFIKLNIEDKKNLFNLFQKEKFDYVINLAAQAGVRYSIENPDVYISSNIVGFLNILEACRHHKIKHLVYASSSSVYGLNGKIPFSTSDNVDHPISLYAASKKSNELMAHTYSHLYNIPTTGLRFFTVYGPWGRPDMALFLFTKAILDDKPIDVYNNGKMFRDFTYIDDIVEGIYKVANNPSKGNKNWDNKNPNPSDSISPYKIYNIGNSTPVKLMDFISEIEKNLNKKAKINFLPLQPGDVEKTWANIDNLKNDFKYRSKIDFKEGINNFITWYLSYYEEQNLKN
jgi:UDP-glucuronate 4-epimerase